VCLVVETNTYNNTVFSIKEGKQSKINSAINNMYCLYSLNVIKTLKNSFDFFTSQIILISFNKSMKTNVDQCHKNSTQTYNIKSRLRS